MPENPMTPSPTPENASAIERQSGPRRLSGDELDFRRLAVARLCSAWPNARLTALAIDEYVNATRGVPLQQLGEVLDVVIAAGGDFVPPAGEVIRRYARQVARQRVGGYSAYLTEQERLEREFLRIVRSYQSAALEVASIAQGPLTDREIEALLREANPGIARLVDRIAERKP